MRANLPAGICFAALVYCCWSLWQSNRKSVLEDPKTIVKITVHGPDGAVIPAVGPVHPPPQPAPKPK